MQAAYYLDIQGLVDLLCKAFANILKNSLERNETLAQIRELLGIPDDLTPYEVAQIKMETDCMLKPKVANE